MIRWLSRRQEIRQRRREEAEAHLASWWDWALTHANRAPAPDDWRESVCLGRVVSHRQRARTGTKAYVQWWANGAVSAAWFASARPPVGSYVVARGSFGWGSHHAERVFYIDAGAVTFMPPGARAAWERRQAHSAAA